MTELITSLSAGVPAALNELRTLGCTPKEARRRRPGLLRPARHEQRSDTGDRRPPRAPGLENRDLGRPPGATTDRPHHERGPLSAVVVTAAPARSAKDAKWLS